MSHRSPLSHCSELGRPRVIMQMSATLDGRITFAPEQTMFSRHPVEGVLPDSASVWEAMSAKIEADWQPHATMMGSGTLLKESAPLRPLPEQAPDESLYTDFLPDEVLATTRDWAVLVDGRGRMRSGYKGTETPGSHIIHLVSPAAGSDYLGFLREQRIPYLVSGSDHVDLAVALGKLHESLGIQAIRLWGGGTLNGAMLRAGLIDEIHCCFWPLLLGGCKIPSLADCGDIQAGQPLALLDLVSAAPQPAGQVWLHYKVRWTKAPGP